LLRNDFTIFDEYELKVSKEDQALDIPLVTFWGTDDRRVKEDHVLDWAQFTTKTFQIEKIKGNHLWPLDKNAKSVWLESIVNFMSEDE
jgi:surfactin synthase thioesterase subunit